MPYAVGVVLAFVVCGCITLVRLDRDRSFYATLTIVVAQYYVLFAVVGGSTSALLAEIAGLLVFAAGAVWAFRRDLRLLAALLAGHGVFDAIHPALVTNPGVPAWWPAFCLGFDVAAGVYLAVLLYRSRSGAADRPAIAA